MFKINNKIGLNSLIAGLCLIMAISFVNAEEINYSALEKSISAYETKLNNLQENLDNTLFDEQELIISLDFDVDETIFFVKQKIAFQPYDGLLRGVQGTLVSRSGNALDQSLLLAKMLGDAGLEARIVVGQLSPQQAATLLKQTKMADLPTHVGHSDAFDNALAAFDTRAMKSKDWQKSLTYQRYQHAKNTLSSVLKNNNVSLNETEITTDLIEKTIPYFWVEHRLGISDPWLAAHPAFSDLNKLDIKAQSYFKGNVPEKYFHKVRIEAFIEQKLGDKVIIHSLMPAWEKPSANLFNFAISYSNHPSGLANNKEYDLKKIIKGSNYFTPLFNGQKVGDKVFDMKGRVIDASAMNTAAGGLFQTIGDKGLLAIDKLNDKKDGSESTMLLKAQWLQFTFIKPDGTEYVQKRYIYERKKPQDLNEAKAQLLSEYILLNTTTDFSIGYLASVYLQLVKDNMPLLKASSELVMNKNKEAKFPKQMTKSEFEILAQYHWMNQNPDLSKDVIRYRDSSNMLGIKRGYINSEKAYLAVDVINNKQQFIKVANDKIFQAPQAAFDQGVWDTASEWIPGKITGVAENSVDTLKVTSAAQQQNIGLLYSANNDNLAQINKIFGADKASLSRIKADIELGYSVIIPAKPPKDLMMSGWWRLNPDTGEILGMTADGGGQTLTEYLIEVTQIALGLVRALGNLHKCEKIKEAGAKVCCLMKAHINNVTGLAVGSFNGAVGGVLASAVFDIADFGKEMVTGSGIVPGAEFSCKSFEPIDDLESL